MPSHGQRLRALALGDRCEAGSSAGYLETALLDDMRPPRQPLHTASDCNQSHLVGPLTSPREAGGCGADVNALLAGDTTPVYLAAQVRVRLTGDGGGWTPSSPRPLSEQRGFSAVVEALVAAGADLDFAMVRRGEQALLEGGSASSCA